MMFFAGVTVGKGAKQRNGRALIDGIGQRLADRRRALGLTQAVLAEKIGVAEETMSRMESGKVAISLERLAKFCDLLDYPMFIVTTRAGDERSGCLVGFASQVSIRPRRFLVGLSNIDADRSRNLQLLKERGWFDVPLVYSNQRRAIIAIEKGSPGDRAFADAFAAWGQ